MKTETQLVVVLAGLAVLVGAVIFWPEPDASPPPRPRREPTLPAGPCAASPDDEEAEPATAGPFAELAALCADWRSEATCERVEPTSTEAELPIDDAFVLTRGAGAEDEESRVALVFAVDGALHRHEVGRAYEEHRSHSIETRSTEEDGDYVVAKLTFVRRFEHQPGNPDGPVQVITRQTWYACGLGRSGAPSCVEIPLRFRRETLRPGEEPSDVAETELSADFCGNGLLLYEGSTDRLTRRNEERAEALQGLSRFVFP